MLTLRGLLSVRKLQRINSSSISVSLDSPQLHQSHRTTSYRRFRHTVVVYTIVPLEPSNNDISSFSLYCRGVTMISYRLILILVSRSVVMVNFLLKSITFRTRNLDMESTGSNCIAPHFQNAVEQLSDPCTSRFNCRLISMNLVMLLILNLKASTIHLLYLIRFWMYKFTSIWGLEKILAS